MVTTKAFRPGPLCLAVVLLSISSTAIAADDAGWFVEADVRYVDADRLISGFTLDDDDYGYSLGLGLRFSRYFSIQAHVHDLGSFFATDCPPPLVCVTTNVDEVDVDGWSFSMTGTYPVNDQFELFGTVGAMDWDADFDRFSDRDDSDTDMLYSAGGAWYPSQDWRLALSYEWMDFDADSIKLALRYNF